MIVNSIKINLSKKARTIELFAGIGNLEPSFEDSIKKNCIRFSSERDDFMWACCREIQNEKEVFFNNWEEEIVGIIPEKRFQAEIDINKNIRLTKAILTQSIVRYFRKRNCPVRRDFIGRIEVWTKTSESDKSVTYQKYTINPRYKDQWRGWQLDIAEGRSSIVSTRNINEFADLQNSGYDVICNHIVISVSKLEQRHWTISKGNFYPVVNRSISEIIGLETSSRREYDKFANKLQAAQRFVDTWLYKEEFKEEVGIEFPEDNKFITLDEQKVMMVDDDAKVLVYGDGYNGKTPRSEFRMHGPYKRPDTPYTYFFINKNVEKSNEARMKLYNILQYAKSYKEGDWAKVTPDKRYDAISVGTPIYNFILQKPLWERGLSILYNSDDSAIDDISEKLKSSKFQKDKKYIAIIVSDIHRDNTDKKKHELYYRVKELLMQYNITSQVIYRDNVDNSSFSYYIPNIAAALVGKMGGMAWGVKSLVHGNDMIVGIGASKQRGVKKPYLGSAFCFDKEGGFRNFNSCRADDTETLMSDLKRSILTFCDDFGNPDRLIIHYYKKKLKREESEQIETMLRQCDVNCPIYVVNVVTANNEDLIAFDSYEVDKMPLSGTYIHLRYNEFLLYNNEKYNSNCKAEKLYPVKLTISNGERYNTRELSGQVVREIITQVYQFCRLYWKSVKMQNIPITIAYPELVAKYVPHFNYEELPEFGRKNLWML